MASADLMLGKFKDDREDESKRDSRDSLKDRFKEARYAAETGQSFPKDTETASIASRSASLAGLGVTTPSTTSHDDDIVEVEPTKMARSASDAACSSLRARSSSSLAAASTNPSPKLASVNSSISGTTCRSISRSRA